VVHYLSRSGRGVSEQGRGRGFWGVKGVGRERKKFKGRGKKPKKTGGNPVGLKHPTTRAGRAKFTGEETGPTKSLTPEGGPVEGKTGVFKKGERFETGE